MRTSSLALSVVLLVVGCDDSDPSGDDAGPAELDAGPGESMDSGAAMDAGDRDAGTRPDAGAYDADVVPPGELVIMPMDPPLTVDDSVVFTTLAYGPGSRNVMDAFLLPEAAAPTPAVIFIHGGGFTGGSRTSAYSGGQAGVLQELVAAGIAYFTIDYSLLAVGSETQGVIKCLRDARRALQFVRYYAEALGVDPDRVALSGSSAGAGTSLWIAFHDEMADPSSPDPIAQQSTRVQAVAVNATQATYELLRWPDDVFAPEYSLTVEQLLSETSLAAQVATFYGLPLSLVPEPEMLEAAVMTPEYVAYRAEVDMLAWMSSDDPPFYARNNAPDVGPDASGFDLLHHPLHAATLADRAAEVDADATVEAPALGLGGDTSPADFLVSHLLP